MGGFECGGSQGCYEFDPLADPRWRPFVESHSRASVFHTTAWLEALRRTYGYKPRALSTCPPGVELRNALVFCRIDSWLTGRRLVSLPFSDHCDPLADSTADLAALIGSLEAELGREDLRYIESRPIQVLDTTGLGPCSAYSYCFHQIDLTPDLATLFRGCHKNCAQRKIRRAEREGLAYEEGRSERLLDSFYRLVRLTRHRQTLLSQPKRWFQSLVDCFGDALKIRIALKDGRPVAGMLTLRHKDTLVYKYGCSDAQFHRFGGMHLLFWKAIQDGKRDGLKVFDLGRSDCANTGLIRFKDRWGAKRSLITYVRFLASAEAKGAFIGEGVVWKDRTARMIFRHLPDCVLKSAGDLIYGHLG